MINKPPPRKVYTISQINLLSAYEKREIYARLIPDELIQRFKLNPYLVDKDGNDLLSLNCPAGSTDADMKLRHKTDFQDPILYGHITDTITGHIHVLLYILNDPESARFEVDRLPDGNSTNFGTRSRNLEAEVKAMNYGLAPGQVRRGLRLLGPAIDAFEGFVKSLGHELYFAEPLHYHNAVIFENYGFSYEKGKGLMERIQTGFSPGGNFLERLNGSTPFRQPEAAMSIRLRSWAVHDGVLGEPFANVTMYKRVGKKAGIKTCVGCTW
ncbi:MAG TPA: hypothetical protein VLA49_17895 [Anaerolineales bacterium]|nr:hypothetical protein [Anaerolineales bacterium]